MGVILFPSPASSLDVARCLSSFPDFNILKADAQLKAQCKLNAAS